MTLAAPLAAQASTGSELVTGPPPIEPVIDPPWYYATRDGDRIGPLDDAALADAYLAGRVTDQTLVWWEGASQWTPLAQAPRFGELDRWYLRGAGGAVTGPMTSRELREAIAQARAQGQGVDRYEVRLALSDWVLLGAAAPLGEPAVTAPPPVPGSIQAVTDPTLTTAAPPSSVPPPPARPPKLEPYDNDLARVTASLRLGVAFPGSATPKEIVKTKLGFGFPLEVDVATALTKHLEVGTYVNYSVRPIKDRGDTDTQGLRHTMVSTGALVQARFPVTQDSRLRIGALVGFNAVWQGFENDVFQGKIVGRGLNVGPSIAWSIDLQPQLALTLQAAGISQVWGKADIGALGAVVSGGSQQDFAFPPLFFFTIGLDACLGRLP